MGWLDGSRTLATKSVVHGCARSSIKAEKVGVLVWALQDGITNDLGG
jgi:hypothetical protein